MMKEVKKTNTIQGKIKIEAKLQLITGMHIGGSSDFQPIGAVDSVIIRDPVTRTPIIPGSSLKGKLRYLLSRALTDDILMKKVDEEPEKIKRLFGASKPEIITARLQFADSFMNKKSIEDIEKINTDLYLSEIKFENTIDRQTCVANPRQIERAVAGSIFDILFVYNVEKLDEVEEDFKNLCSAIKLLHLDYLGGHGTRGYGRVKLYEFKLNTFTVNDNDIEIDLENLENILKGAEEYALLSI